MPEKPKSPVKAVSRTKIGAFNSLVLFVRAGGWCEMDGCPQYLLQHDHLKTRGNFAQMAHICAYSDGGPRFDEAIKKGSINALENLMLLCPQCHKVIDDDPDAWPVERLRLIKKEHEDRIRMLTAIRPDRRTMALVLRAQIHGQKPTLSLPEIQEAVAPRYVGEGDVCDIDLTEMPDDSSDSYWKMARKAVESKVARFYDQELKPGAAWHASVFGLARIPLLVHFGRCLDDKVGDRLHQRHRGPTGDEMNWLWRSEGAVARYSFRCVREGTESSAVALLLPLSGPIPLSSLPDEIDGRFWVYELALEGQAPGLGFLGREESLGAFRSQYLQAIGDLHVEHPGLDTVSVFPAVPAPVAIAMGRDRLPARHPRLLLYDLVKDEEGSSRYIRTIEVG